MGQILFFQRLPRPAAVAAAAQLLELLSMGVLAVLVEAGALDIIITTEVTLIFMTEWAARGHPAKDLMAAGAHFTQIPVVVAALEKLAEQTELALVEMD
jgi:hypothetical protein